MDCVYECARTCKRVSERHRERAEALIVIGVLRIDYLFILVIP